MKRKSDGFMTFEEIGRELGITKQCAEQTYARAIAKLRKHMRKNPKLAEELRAMLREEPESDDYARTVLDAQVGFPEVWYWTLMPVPYTSNWEARALRTLDLVY